MTSTLANHPSVIASQRSSNERTSNKSLIAVSNLISTRHFHELRSTRLVIVFLFAVSSCCHLFVSVDAAVIVPFDHSSITSNINNRNHVASISSSSSSLFNDTSTNRAAATVDAETTALNRAPLQWDDDILYDKEGQVGTWCAPSSSSSPEASPSSSSSHLANNVQQQMPARHSFPPAATATDIQETISSSSASMAATDALSSADGVDESRLIRWVDAALRLVRIQEALEQQQQTVNVEDEAKEKEFMDRRRRRKRRQQSQQQQQSYHLVPSEMNLYVAVSSSQWNGSSSSSGGGSRNRLMAVLPDGVLTVGGSSSKAITKDAWIVLDPTPHLPFSHTVHVFGVTYDTPDAVCIANGGLPLEGNDCLNRVLKNRCSNIMAGVTHSSARRRSSHQQQHNCQVDFLPLVQPTLTMMQHDQGSSSLSSSQQQTKQRLLCTNRVPGFASCPHLRPANETSELICDPLGTNHKRCDTTQDVVKTRCRLFETCDQAVLLSGGWNWQLSGHRQMAHLLAMYRMLRRNGFAQEAIKIFFANGVRAGKEHSTSNDGDDSGTPLQHQETIATADDSGSLEFVSTSKKILEETSKVDVEKEARHEHEHKHHHHHHDLLNRKDNPAMYPAALKLAMRNHLRMLCSSARCVDSLVVYMSSSTRSSDGASLLWDADVNGQADETEVYTVREFLRDIQDCTGARQVVVLADQNHSELIIEALQKSKRHSNVVAFASGTSTHEVRPPSSQQHYSGSSKQIPIVGRHLTHFWANYQHSHACLSKVFQDSLLVSKAPSSHASTTMTAAGGNQQNVVMPLFYDSSSSSSSGDGSSSLSSSNNLFGAPCNAIPPYTLNELETHYMGCQYIPTRLWMQQMSSSNHQQLQSEEGEEDGEHQHHQSSDLQDEEQDRDDYGSSNIRARSSDRHTGAGGSEDDPPPPPRLLSGGRR